MPELAFEENPYPHQEYHGGVRINMKTPQQNSTINVIENLKESLKMGNETQIQTQIDQCVSSGYIEALKESIDQIIEKYPKMAEVIMTNLWLLLQGKNSNPQEYYQTYMLVARIAAKIGNDDIFDQIVTIFEVDKNNLALTRLNFYKKIKIH